MHFLLKQDKLDQDVFLIGSPGPSRRLLAMQYLVNLMINKFLNILYYNNLFISGDTCSLIGLTNLHVTDYFYL